MKNASGKSMISIRCDRTRAISRSRSCGGSEGIQDLGDSCSSRSSFKGKIDSKDALFPSLGRFSPKKPISTPFKGLNMTFIDNFMKFTQQNRGN